MKGPAAGAATLIRSAARLGATGAACASGGQLASKMCRPNAVAKAKNRHSGALATVKSQHAELPCAAKPQQVSGRVPTTIITDQGAEHWQVSAIPSISFVSSGMGTAAGILAFSIVWMLIGCGVLTTGTAATVSPAWGYSPSEQYYTPTTGPIYAGHSAWIRRIR